LPEASVPPVYPQVKWLKEHGVGADVIIGARTKDLLILTEEMKQVAREVFVCTVTVRSLSTAMSPSFSRTCQKPG
jgi:NAD(P)H-flavin reductase